VPEVPHPDESVKFGAATDDSKPGQDLAVSATAKLLCGVRDSGNASIPLRSVAGHLYFILENCQVWPPTCTFSPQCLLSSQQTEVDKQAIELLALRVKALYESLIGPIQPSDVNEKKRGENLEQCLISL